MRQLTANIFRCGFLAACLTIAMGKASMAQESGSSDIKNPVVAEVLAKADNPDVVYQARRRLTEALLRLDKLLSGEDAGRARPEGGAASGMTAGKEED